MEKNQKPQFCYTVTAYLINKGKILLIKHKKLGIWIMPGGHIDENELPHQAAEREFWEETGIKVKAIGYESEDSMPIPFKSGLYWICKENYERRKKGKKSLKKWKKGCEQHFDLGYIVESLSGFKYKKNIKETDGIDWFSFSEIEKLNTFDNIKKSIKMALKLI